MSLRRLVDELIGADRSGAIDAAPGSDRAEGALEAGGFGMVDAELYGEALLHYAESSPIDVADALAPVVTAASAVPLDPELDPVGPAAEAHDSPVDVDPDTLDESMTSTREFDDEFGPGGDAIDDEPGTSEMADDATGDTATGSEDGVDSAPVDAYGVGSTDARVAADAADQASRERVEGVDDPTAQHDPLETGAAEFEAVQPAGVDAVEPLPPLGDERLGSTDEPIDPGLDGTDDPDVVLDD